MLNKSPRYFRFLSIFTCYLINEFKSNCMKTAPLWTNTIATLAYGVDVFNFSASWLPWEVRKFNWVHGLIFSHWLSREFLSSSCITETNRIHIALARFRLRPKKGSTECSRTFLGLTSQIILPFPIFHRSLQTLFFWEFRDQCHWHCCFVIADEHRDRKHSSPEIPWLLSCSLTPTQAFLPF